MGPCPIKSNALGRLPEVRSENDYGDRAEEEMARKRADYFAAGTTVVWDVDLLSEEVIKVYRASDPYHPTVYRRGEIAEMEDIFRSLGSMQTFPPPRNLNDISGFHYELFAEKTP